MTPPAPRYGALPEDWTLLDETLGLTADLLPVVSNPNATIDPNSTLSSLGKTPSRYNRNGYVAGMAKWTAHITNAAQVEDWKKQKDYGICLQTRVVKALDVDVTDEIEAARIEEFINQRFVFPRRGRSNSPKFLLAFMCSEVDRKRVIKVKGGMIELLATGQQFVTFGCHPSGVRYDWGDDGMRYGIPKVTLAQVDALWEELQGTFGIEPEVTSKATSKPGKVLSIMEHDPIVIALGEAELIRSVDRNTGRLNITCPFEEEHSDDSGETSTVYWPSNTGGYANGHFDCKHAHCEHRIDQDFLDKIGYAEDMSAEFEALGAAVEAPGDEGTPVEASEFEALDEEEKLKYKFKSVKDFCDRPNPHWLVRNVIPDADLTLLVGAPASGKTFIALDMAMAIARGVPWRDRSVKQGRVAYVAAEGAHGFSLRMRAYLHQHNVDPDTIPLSILDAAPNFTSQPEVLDLCKAIKAQGSTSIVFVDTLAQVTPGADENSGKDMGKALALCKGIRKATHAAVVLIHHLGKDASRGARGWSGLLGAADAEISIERFDSGDRIATVTKLKDGQDGVEFGFRLDNVVVGLDEEGEEITSCIVQHSDAAPRSKRVKAKPLTEEQRAALACFEEMLGLDDGASGVDEAVWFDAALEVMPDKHNRRRDAKKAIKTLIDLKRVVERGGFYYLPNDVDDLI